uniref:NTF2-related export protein n=1 Tax=Equus caballus TaxID=9796 RepID=A0A9L0T3P5_HORSE
PGGKENGNTVGSVIQQKYHMQLGPTEEGKRNSEAAHLSWGGEQFQGKAAILGELTNMPFQKIQRIITSYDHQPVSNNSILTLVVGKLKVDEEMITEFHQLFVLKNMNHKWICTSDIFRAALCNFHCTICILTLYSVNSLV